MIFFFVTDRGGEDGLHYLSCRISDDARPLAPATYIKIPEVRESLEHESGLISPQSHFALRAYLNMSKDI